MFQEGTVAPTNPLKIAPVLFSPGPSSDNDGGGGGSLLSAYYVPLDNSGISISQSWIQTEYQGTP